MRCRRDARGNIHRLEYVHPRRHPLRPGLAVSLHAPPRVQPGTTVRYIARVHNRRRGSRRLLSSLWDITLNAYTLNGHDRTMRIRELRRGRSRRVTFTRRVPRGARGRCLRRRRCHRPRDPRRARPCLRAGQGGSRAHGHGLMIAHSSQMPTFTG